MVLADLRPLGISGKDLQGRCDENHMTLNKNAIPNDPASPSVTSGARIGTPAVTTRGLKEEDMATIAHCIGQTARDFAGTRQAVLETVAALCRKYPLYQG